MDTLRIEPRAFRMRSGCDTTTPCTLDRFKQITHTHTQLLPLLRHRVVLGAVEFRTTPRCLGPVRAHLFSHWDAVSRRQSTHPQIRGPLASLEPAKPSGYQLHPLTN